MAWINGLHAGYRPLSPPEQHFGEQHRPSGIDGEPECITTAPVVAGAHLFRPPFRWWRPQPQAITAI